MIKRALILPWAAGLSIACAAAAQAPLQQAPSQLGAFLSHTFTGELAAPESADRIDWMELHQDRRRIWFAKVLDYQFRRLTNGTADDGRGLSEPALSPDGRLYRT